MQNRARPQWTPAKNSRGTGNEATVYPRAWLSSLVTSISHICSELGREQGSAYPFDSVEKEEGGQEMCAVLSKVTHGEQGRSGPLFASSEKWAQNLPSSHRMSVPQTQPLLPTAL